MLKLNVSSEMKKYHIAYFNHYIVKRLNSSSIIVKIKKETSKKEKNKKDNFIKKHEHNIVELSNVLIDKLKILAIGSCEELRNINNDIEEKYNSFNEDKEFIKNIVLQQFGYENIFVKGHAEYCGNGKLSDDVRLAKKWNPYTWATLLNVRTCAYCNRQYVTCLPKNNENTNTKGGIRPDIEHFWPKNKYPHFSMSLYNWVPSCRYCNSSLKGEQSVDINEKTLYEIDFGTKFKFQIDNFIKSSKIKVSVFNNEKNISNLLNLFRIEEQYQAHNNVAIEMMMKKLIYNKELMDKIIQEKCKYLDKGTLDTISLIIGCPRSEEEIDNESLGKLKYDLAKQLEFI